MRRTSLFFLREMLMDQNRSLLPWLGKKQEERGVSRKKRGEINMMLSFPLFSFSFRALGLVEELQRAVA